MNQHRNSQPKNNAQRKVEQYSYYLKQDDQKQQQQIQQDNNFSDQSKKVQEKQNLMGRAKQLFNCFPKFNNQDYIEDLSKEHQDLFKNLRAQVKKRALKNFLGEKQFIGKYLDEEIPYATAEKKKQIFHFISGIKEYQKVRGDGNCFYTSLLYGIIIMFQKSSEDLEKFIDTIEIQPITIVDKIPKKDQQFNHNQNKLLKDYIKKKIKECNNNKIEDLFKIDQLYFYEAFVFLSRSLVYNCCKEKQSLMLSLAGDFDPKIVLMWEYESPQYTEAIIYVLVNTLQISIILYSLNQESRVYEPDEGESKRKIGLLFTGGHYGVVFW